MPFWCETRWRSSACVFSATTGEMSNQDPWVLKGMSWTEKAGPDRSAVMKRHSFLGQGWRTVRRTDGEAVARGTVSP